MGSIHSMEIGETAGVHEIATNELGEENPGTLSEQGIERAQGEPEEIPGARLEPAVNTRTFAAVLCRHPAVLSSVMATLIGGSILIGARYIGKSVSESVFERTHHIGNIVSNTSRPKLRQNRNSLGEQSPPNFLQQFSEFGTNFLDWPIEPGLPPSDFSRHSR